MNLSKPGSNTISVTKGGGVIITNAIGSRVHEFHKPVTKEIAEEILVLCESIYEQGFRDGENRKSLQLRNALGIKWTS